MHVQGIIKMENLTTAILKIKSQNIMNKPLFFRVAKFAKLSVSEGLKSNGMQDLMIKDREFKKWLKVELANSGLKFNDFSRTQKAGMLTKFGASDEFKLWVLDKQFKSNLADRTGLYNVQFEFSVNRVVDKTYYIDCTLRVELDGEPLALQIFSLVPTKNFCTLNGAQVLASMQKFNDKDKLVDKYGKDITQVVLNAFYLLAVKKEFRKADIDGLLCDLECNARYEQNLAKKYRAESTNKYR
ncbi:MAG: hypothetical protein ACRCYT_01050 [Cetobacterium sp.]